MSQGKDFSNMTLEELSAIVSQRPGKAYTREELSAARTAFLTMLGMESEPPAPEEKAEMAEEAADDAQAKTLPEASAHEAEAPPRRKRSFSKRESRPFLFFYRLYAYFLLPLLVLEALFLLLGGVTAAVFVPDIPFLFLHVVCAVLYTMLLTLSWHQFLHRTRCGLVLNRGVLFAGILRGILSFYAPGGFVCGFLFVAVFSFLFLFFLGYEHAFTMPSPKKSRGR